MMIVRCDEDGKLYLYDLVRTKKKRASFERALLFYHCKNESWKDVLEKLWNYTNIEYLDDWFYEIAE